MGAVLLAVENSLSLYLRSQTDGFGIDFNGLSVAASMLISPDCLSVEIGNLPQLVRSQTDEFGCGLCVNSMPTAWGVAGGGERTAAAGMHIAATNNTTTSSTMRHEAALPRSTY